MSVTHELLIRDTILDEIHDHIVDGFPQEACGLLVEGDDGPCTVLAENLADTYHALDPETYPHTADRAYILDPMLIARAKRNGQRLIAIFHSHVRVGAYFYDEDIAQALSPVGEKPLYPGVDYVVFDAQEEGVVGHKVFHWDTASEAFVQC